MVKTLIKWVICILRFVAIAVICILFLVPLLYMISTSFKNFKQVFTIPPTLVFMPTMKNYHLLIFEHDYMKFFFNSALVSTISVVITLLICIPAAYSLAKLDFRGRENIAFWILSIRMFPPIVILVPLFIIFRTLNLVGSRWSLIFSYQMLNIPLVVWMLKGFFKEVPGDIEDAALIDGCNRLGFLFRILLPVSKVGVIATGLLGFVFCWNEFLFASVFTSIETRTIPVAVTQFIRLRGVMWGPMTAATVATVIPVWVLGLALQKHIIRGMSLGAVK